MDHRGRECLKHVIHFHPVQPYLLPLPPEWGPRPHLLPVRAPHQQPNKEPRTSSVVVPGWG
jgi:hypothetical protein